MAQTSLRRLLSGIKAPHEQSAPSVETLSRHPAALRRRMRRNEWLSSGLFLLPATLIFTAVVMYPVLSNGLYAFTNWDGLSPHVSFTGLANFISLIHDTAARGSMWNTLVFTLVTAPLQLGLGLLLALALKGRNPLLASLRVLYILPILFSGLALSLIATYIYSPQFGILDTFLTSIHLSGLVQDWLGNPRLALPSLIVISVWQWAGYNMLIYLAGLESIPTDYYEATKIDGANAWQRFWHVTWPLLAPAVTINVLLTVIGGLKVFDLMYVTTHGGPDGATESLVMYVTQVGFGFGHYSYAAAMDMVLTVFILFVSILLLRVLRNREVGF